MFFTRFSFSLPARLALATIGNIEATSLEKKGGGVDDAAQLALTLGTGNQRRFAKLLPFLKTESTLITFVIIDGHLPHLKQNCHGYFTGIAILEANRKCEYR
jgi:hypothetical protein